MKSVVPYALMAFTSLNYFACCNSYKVAEKYFKVRIYFYPSGMDIFNLLDNLELILKCTFLWIYKERFKFFNPFILMSWHVLYLFFLYQSVNLLNLGEVEWKNKSLTFKYGNLFKTWMRLYLKEFNIYIFKLRIIFL